jgi:hypothetical protein
MAAIGLRRRPAPGETQAVALMVLALALLAAGLAGGGRHASFAPAALAAALALLIAGAASFAAFASGPYRALTLGAAGGLLYGAADMSLKAVTGLHGFGAIVLSPWLYAGLACTAGAFFAFQRGLQSSRPVAVIALMTAATNVSSIVGAFVVYVMQHPFSQEFMLPAPPEHVEKQSELPIKGLTMGFPLLGVFVGIDEETGRRQHAPNFVIEARAIAHS